MKLMLDVLFVLGQFAGQVGHLGGHETSDDGEKQKSKKHHNECRRHSPEPPVSQPNREGSQEEGEQHRQRDGHKNHPREIKHCHHYDDGQKDGDPAVGIGLIFIVRG